MFGQAAGVDPNTLVAGHPFFDVVKHYLMPHAEKAAAKPVKKKVKQPEQDVAENYWDRLQRERALESAGVGIITKQNSTVDVNKNTPKKNLKAFRLI